MRNYTIQQVNRLLESYSYEELYQYTFDRMIDEIERDSNWRLEVFNLRGNLLSTATGLKDHILALMERDGWGQIDENTWGKWGYRAKIYQLEDNQCQR